MVKKILFLHPSARKWDTKEDIPAIARYDGEQFKIVRYYVPQIDEIFILTGKYGLITARTKIPIYKWDEDLLPRDTNIKIWNKHNIVRPFEKWNKYDLELSAFMPQGWFTILQNALPHKITFIPDYPTFTTYCIEYQATAPIPPWWTKDTPSPKK